MAKKEKIDRKAGESLLIIKPVTRWFGLDYLHVMLAVLVIILIAFTFSLALFKQGVLVQNCQYGLYNGTCVTPVHNSSQALTAAEQVLASYSTANSSLSLLPYYSLPAEANVSFLSNQSEWFVVIPYIDPLVNNRTFYLSLLLRDSNLSLAMPFVQTINPSTITKNMVVALGAVSLYGKTACTNTAPIPVYDIVDPYAPGAMQSIFTGLNETKVYGNKVNITYKFVATSYTGQFLSGYTLSDVGAVGTSLLCASLQSGRFTAYMKNFSIVYTGKPISNTTLLGVAEGSGLDMPLYNQCIQNSSVLLHNQAMLANFYGVQTTPTYIVNCEYETIPQQLGTAINYALNQTG